MLHFPVNRTPQSAKPCSCHTSENYPANSFPCHTSKSLDLESFPCHTSKKTLGGTPPHLRHPVTNQSRVCPSAPRALFTLLSLFAPRVIHISLPFNRLHTLLQKCRGYGVPLHKILKVLLELISHFGWRLFPFPLTTQLVLSRPLCDNLGLPFQQKLRLRCPLRAPGKQ
jgi:hypothetical protein